MKIEGLNGIYHNTLPSWNTFYIEILLSLYGEFLTLELFTNVFPKYYFLEIVKYILYLKEKLLKMFYNHKICQPWLIPAQIWGAK